MAYVQKNSPFKKTSPVKGKLDDLFKNIGKSLRSTDSNLQDRAKKHSDWSKKKVEESKARREETGRPMGHKYSSTQQEYHKNRKPGESKFKYDARMRKEGRKTISTDPTSRYQAPDPSAKISIGYRKKHLPSYNYTNRTGVPSMQERNPGDLRRQSMSTASYLPSAPGDEWEYSLDQYEYGDKVLWAIKGDDYHEIEPGSKSDKAIRKRYTGSETGDLSNWYGHDTYGEYSSYDWDHTLDEGTGDIVEGTHSSADFEKKSYLPYDLAQRHYNPKYKGSKK